MIATEGTTITDNEFGETVLLVHLKDRAQVDIGFSGTCLHLDGEVFAIQGAGLFETVDQLYLLGVFKQLFFNKTQAVAYAEIVLFRSGQCIHLAVLVDHRGRGHREGGSACLLAFKDADHSINGVFLVGEVRVELKLHELSFFFLPANFCTDCASSARC